MSPDLLIGGLCSEGIWLNENCKVIDEKDQSYNDVVQSLLRHPKLDLLIVEYPEDIFLREGMAYEGSNLVILDEPTEIEKTLMRDVLSQHKLILRQRNQITVGTQDKMEVYFLEPSESFEDFCFHQTHKILEDIRE